LSGTYQFLVYADDVNILGEKVHNISTEALLIDTKDKGLEVNVGKLKYMVMPQYQNRRRRHNVKMHNNFFEMGEDFNYLGTILRNRNSIQENRSKSFGTETFVVKIATKQYKD